MTANDYMLGVREFELPPFDGKLWQRNYFEHVIRTDASLDRIRRYLARNPSNWEEDDDNLEAKELRMNRR